MSFDFVIAVSNELWWLNGFVTVATHAPPPAPVQGTNGSVMGGLGAAVADGKLISLPCI